MASQTDHIEHVKTQLPYALVAGSAAAGLFVAGLGDVTLLSREFFAARRQFLLHLFVSMIRSVSTSSQSSSTPFG